MRVMIVRRRPWPSDVSVAVPARHQVHVQVKHALTAGLTGVLAHRQPIGPQPGPDLAGDDRARTPHGSRRLGVRGPQIRDMVARDHEGVAAGRRPGVEHRDAVLVLGDDMGLLSTGRDPAEKAPVKGVD